MYCYECDVIINDDDTIGHFKFGGKWVDCCPNCSEELKSIPESLKSLDSEIEKLKSNVDFKINFSGKKNDLYGIIYKCLGVGCKKDFINPNIIFSDVNGKYIYQCPHCNGSIIGIIQPDGSVMKY